jgi:membrane-bound lytic murein transglycosylase F
MKYYIWYILFIGLLCSCSSNQSTKYDKTTIDSSFTAVKRTRELRAIVNFNATDYYIDRGTPMGFQLELLNNYYILELTDRFKKLTEVKP